MQQKSLNRRQLLGGATGATALAIGSPLFLSSCMSGSTVALDQRHITQLRETLDGTLLDRNDQGYELARRVGSFNPRTDFRPQAIVRCTSTSDVQRTIRFSREHSLPLAVRGGGNDVLGQSSVDRGIVLDLSAMSDVELDDETRNVKVDGGALTGSVSGSLSPHGLAVPLACNPIVGVGGLTLGGGMGWLVSSAGAACDNVVQIELIDAEGRLITVNAQSDPDLFWALKGGGGNFGVVTRFDYRTLELREAVTGFLVFPIAAAGEFLAAFDDLMDRAPRELTVELVLFDSGAGTFLAATVCFAGDPRNAAQAIAPFRRVVSPIADTIQVQPYISVGQPTPEIMAAFPPVETPQEDLEAQASGNSFNHWRGDSIARLSSDVIEVLLRAVETAPPGWSMGLGHCQRGAFVDFDPTSSSLPRTQGSSSLFISASWYREEMTAPSMAWVDRVMDELRAYNMPQTYVNYLSSDAPSAVSAAYGPNYARLSELKSRIDPENIFHGNRNIRS